MSEKVLTIAIPSYNSEKCIEKGLNSYIGPDGTMDPRLELIIVNDGSTDRTAEIGQEWVSRFPENICLINKENGGHGSGINAGLDAATGRYYKVIDSDDWVVTDNITPILDELEKTEADAVVTGYDTVNIASGAVNSYGTGQSLPSQEVINSMGEQYSQIRCFGPREASVEEFVQDVNNIPAVQSFHGIMYRTDFLRGTGIRMSEKVFFEDQEYAVLPFAFVQTVCLLPYFLYEYQIGSADQSVDFENQARRSGDFLKVVQRMVDFHLEHLPLPDANDDFIQWRIANATTSYYSITLIKSSDKETGRKLAEEFRAYMMEKEPAIANRAERKYESMLKLSNKGWVLKLYSKLFNSKKFSMFKSRWTR